MSGDQNMVAGNAQQSGGHGFWGDATKQIADISKCTAFNLLCSLYQDPFQIEVRVHSNYEEQPRDEAMKPEIVISAGHHVYM